MKIKLPDAEEFCKNLDDELGEWWSNDYEELVKRMEEYGKLCVEKAVEVIKSEVSKIPKVYTYRLNKK